jgi:hypothetical protein
MRAFRAALLAATLLEFMAGCEEQWPVNFESDPPGAKCYLNGRYLGTTPLTAKVRFRYMPTYSEGWGACVEFVFPGHERADCPQLPGYEGTNNTLVTSAPAGGELYLEGVLIGLTPHIDNFDFAHKVKAVFPKDPKIVQGKIFVSCDLRIVRVSDGSVVAAAGGQSSPERFNALGEELTEGLRENMFVKGELIAVVSLRNRSGTPGSQALADELADKLTGALLKCGWFDVRERISLRSILAEKDLEKTDLVKSAKVREKIVGLKYIVIGGVSVSRPDAGE